MTTTSTRPPETRATPPGRRGRPENGKRPPAKLRPQTPKIAKPQVKVTDVKLADIGRTLARYKGYIGAFAVVVLLAVVVPGEIGPGPGVDQLATPGASGVGATYPATRGPVEEAPEMGATELAATDDGYSTVDAGSLSGSVAAPATPAAPSSSATRTTPGSTTTRRDSGGAVDKDTLDTVAKVPAPLVIVAKAWASSAAGTPLAEAGVVEGSLPVGTRLGQHDKRSFVRLAGDEEVLVLKEIADESGQRSPETGRIKACAIRSDWDEGEAIAFEDAPTYDASACTVGIRDADSGTWSFDLAAFPDRTSGKGFALIPANDAPLDFQVAFEA